MKLCLANIIVEMVIFNDQNYSNLLEIFQDHQEYQGKTKLESLSDLLITKEINDTSGAKRIEKIMKYILYLEENTIKNWFEIHI